MFTGIIREVAEIAAVRKTRGSFRVSVQKPARWKVKAGESVCVNGICSTVTSTKNGKMFFEYMPETLRKTTAAAWHVGGRVNLERSLRVGDPLDGHLVAGHIDGVGRIAASVRDGGARLLKIEAAAELQRYIAKKGSVAIDGVSLTVAHACPPRAARRRRVCKAHFTVALIPYTLAHTNLRERRVGDKVNLEVDILAKYATRQMANQTHSYIPRNVGVTERRKKRKK